MDIVYNAESIKLILDKKLKEVKQNLK